MSSLMGYEAALDAANYFRSIGLVPLPSRMTGRKQPIIDYAHLRTQRVPSSVYTKREWKTTNIQLMTGVETTGSTKIVVVDIDGPEAMDAWIEITKKEGFSIKESLPWVTQTGSGGMHFYYRLPESAVTCVSRLVWGLFDTRTGWVKHKEIRLLGDKSLVVAPPSARIDGTGSYRWAKGNDPRSVPLPGYAPAWLLDMPGWLAPERHYCDQPKPNNKKEFHCASLRQRVIDSITPTEKLALVKSWGLRFPTDHPRITTPWMICRSVYREDSTPSAGWNPESGVYNEAFGSGKGLSFFDLSVALGAFRTWQEALDCLAEKYIK
jgi:Bifunctional DNA primase/polymerase, N-terminal